MIDFNTPPQNIEAERGVLGSMLLDETARLDVLEYLAISDFHREVHRIIYETIRDMENRHIEIDTITISEELRRRDQLDAVGGRTYIAGLANSVPHAANARYYADIVAEKSMLRQIDAMCKDMACKVAAEEGKAVDLLLELQHKADSVKIHRHGGEPVRLMDLSMAALDALEEKRKNPGLYTGLKTGLYDLDILTGGLQRGDLAILAGRPSMGKSALAQRIVQGVAENEPNAGAILWVSLEMPQEQIVTRWLCSMAKVDSAHIRIGRISDEEMRQLSSAMGRLAGFTSVHICDAPAQAVMEIRAKARRLKNRHGMALVVVDYLQLMGGKEKAERRDLEVGEMSRGLKALARELDCSVLALSQLNRAVESRQVKVPGLADLRESGSLEQDADVVMFITREEYYNPGTRKGEADLIIAKQRNGPCDTVVLSFQKQYAAFEPLAWAQRRAEG